jgi:hypothetical protein
MSDVGVPSIAGWRRLCDGAMTLLAAKPSSVSYRRGAAFLARQAIERGVRAITDARVGPDARWATRFLILGAIRPGIDATRGRALWSRWSEICHYSTYDLVPLADDLQRRVDETAAWLNRLARTSSAEGTDAR